MERISKILNFFLNYFGLFLFYSFTFLGVFTEEGVQDSHVKVLPLIYEGQKCKGPTFDHTGMPLFIVLWGHQLKWSRVFI